MPPKSLFLLIIIGVLALGCDEDPELYSLKDYDGDSETTDDDSFDSDSDTHDEIDTNSSDLPADIVNICDEDVPSEHYVDGIPAYSQCPDSQNGAIWSDNGLNTSTVQEDTNWVRTQWSMGYQCTEFAKRYLYFVWDVTNVPNGNAGDWCNGTPPNGLIKTSSPVHGDIMVFAPGSCGASQTYGHVAVVDTVDEINQRAEFVEQNGTNRRSCDISTAACFLHAESNNN